MLSRFTRLRLALRSGCSRAFRWTTITSRRREMEAEDLPALVIHRPVGRRSSETLPAKERARECCPGAAIASPGCDRGTERDVGRLNAHKETLMPLRSSLTQCLLAAAIAMPVAFLAPTIARADAPLTAPASASGSAIAQAQRIADRGFDYLKTQQKPDFSWQNSYDPPGITAIVLRAFMADEKFDADQPFLDKAFNKLLSFQKENGGIYQDALANYNTAIAISALAVSKEEEYKKSIAKALEYLRSLQFSDKIEGVQPDVHVDSDASPKFGGFGYGKKGRPDLSNTQFALDALHDAGVQPGDPAFAAAMKFATRCQNLSETNDQKFAGDDGGFIYTDDGTEGSDPAGEYKGPDGRTLFRSYGSMTYAGLKSMIYA